MTVNFMNEKNLGFLAEMWKMKIKCETEWVIKAVGREEIDTLAHHNYVELGLHHRNSKWIGWIEP